MSIGAFNCGFWIADLKIFVLATAGLITLGTYIHDKIVALRELSFMATMMTIWIIAPTGSVVTEKSAKHANHKNSYFQLAGFRFIRVRSIP